MYDVLEGWAAASDGLADALVRLAEELLESITVVKPSRANAQPAPYELRNPADVEWSGLLRFRPAAPTTLNWMQTKRLVEAATAWRAWDLPSATHLTDIANGRWAPPTPLGRPSPRAPPSARLVSSSGGGGGGMEWVPPNPSASYAAAAGGEWQPAASPALCADPLNHVGARPSQFCARVEASQMRNNSLIRRSPHARRPEPPPPASSDAAPNGLILPEPLGTSPIARRPPKHSQPWYGDEPLYGVPLQASWGAPASERARVGQLPTHRQRMGPRGNVALVYASEWVAHDPAAADYASGVTASRNSYGTGLAPPSPRGGYGLPDSLASPRNLSLRPPIAQHEHHKPSSSLAGHANLPGNCAPSGAAWLPEGGSISERDRDLREMHAAQAAAANAAAAFGELQELGAMRVAQRGELSERAAYGASSARTASANATAISNFYRQRANLDHMGAPPLSKERPPIGLGLASSAAKHDTAAERTAFAGHALFADTLRRREKLSARTQAGVRGSPRADAPLAVGTLAPPGEASSEGRRRASKAADAREDGISAVEHQYAWMDRELLRQLTGERREKRAFSNPLKASSHVY